jgi:excisionase family DNA binding protein
MMIAPTESHSYFDDDHDEKETPEPTPMESGTLKLALSSHAAAKALDISERTLWTLSKAGKIRSFRIGNARRYPVAELERYIAERTNAAETEPPYQHAGYANLEKRNTTPRRKKTKPRRPA